MVNLRAIAVLLLFVSSARAQPSFELFAELTPEGMSRDGRFVVGYVSGIRAAIWDRQLGTVQTLGTLPTIGAASSVAYAISNDGRFIVGQSKSRILEKEAFRFDRNTNTMTGLGDLQSGLADSIAVGVAGWSDLSYRSKRWSVRLLFE